MSIIATEIESVHGTAQTQRLIYYVCTDDQGGLHKYGPIISNDQAFDADAFKTVVAAKMAEYLAEAEAASLLGA